MSRYYSYYLSAEESSKRMVLFRAVFSETCQIKNCFIMASSLHEAMITLYEQLCPVWPKFYLDNHLIKLHFHNFNSYE